MCSKTFGIKVASCRKAIRGTHRLDLSRCERPARRRRAAATLRRTAGSLRALGHVLHACPAVQQVHALGTWGEGG